MSMLLVSCGNSNPLTGKLWFGEIIRVKDSQVLSPIVLDFKGENLKVYANAIFGSSRTDFTLNSENDNQYFYANKEKNIFLVVEINQDNSITISPNQGGKFYANAIVDEKQSKKFVDNQYENKEKSFNPENYLSGASYEGFLYRESDNTKLSKIVLVGNNDTTKVFSNAIFGANNIVLNNVGFHKGLDCFKYSTNEHKDILIYSSDNGLKIEGNDFYAVLEPVYSSNIDYSFFNNKKVSHNPSHYPTPNTNYFGYINKTNPKIANELQNITISATIKFIDNNSLIFTQNFQVSDTYLRLYSLTYGLDYNKSKKFTSFMNSTETSHLSYYINEKGQIVAEDKKAKTKDIFVLSEDRQTINWENKESGFNGEFKVNN